MSLATNKIILAGATSNTDGAYFQTSIVNAVATGNGTVVPAGIYLMVPAANVTVVANTGSANSTILANNTGGMIISDGYNGTPAGFDNCCENENGETNWYVLHAEANAILKVGYLKLIEVLYFSNHSFFIIFLLKV